MKETLFKKILCCVVMFVILTMCLCSCGESKSYSNEASPNKTTDVKETKMVTYDIDSKDISSYLGSEFTVSNFKSDYKPLTRTDEVSFDLTISVFPTNEAKYENAVIICDISSNPFCTLKKNSNYEFSDYPNDSMSYYVQIKLDSSGRGSKTINLSGNTTLPDKVDRNNVISRIIVCPFTSGQGYYSGKITIEE